MGDIDAERIRADVNAMLVDVLVLKKGKLDQVDNDSFSTRRSF